MADETLPALDPKKPWLSKTLWVNALMAALALIPGPAHEWAVAHQDLMMMVVTGVNMLLRLVTKDKIGLSQ